VQTIFGIFKMATIAMEMAKMQVTRQTEIDET
jgi:hypothetical protein